MPTPQTREMVVVHRAFRREFRLASALVLGVRTGDTARSRVLAEHIQGILRGLHLHHTGEDELLWPKLRERVVLEAELVARMEEQHDLIAALCAKVEAKLPAWRVTADPELGTELAATIQDLARHLGVHLDEEERHILPLVAKHITVAEWEQLGARGLAETPKNRLMLVLGSLLEDATPEERTIFLAKLPPVGKIMWHLVGQRQYRAETLRIRQP